MFRRSCFHRLFFFPLFLVWGNRFLSVICILEMHQLIPFSTIPNHETQPIEVTTIQSLNLTVSEHNEKLQLRVFCCSYMPKTDTNMSISRNYNFWFSIAPVCPNWYKHVHLEKLQLLVFHCSRIPKLVQTCPSQWRLSIHALSTASENKSTLKLLPWTDGWTFTQLALGFYCPIKCTGSPQDQTFIQIHMRFHASRLKLQMKTIIQTNPHLSL